ncbi:2-dehydro-3-deoxygalactonokinase [Nitratireductor sp. ZSWI3]|uniref:2-dehydro-3-deoxygalactonokinase n=1 Tax=Nitratireductor sp. ZSWI3 TaxID=2966359 RepID=UPI00214FC1A7|nr:2-dehydro-3-deoxygalactonokinase [Nitratireductor sp. ZSWI3]MCR4268463.1 2-dehydro-3-deoxygalactonokinase [Nitratireductor sp. ZSWI3]
MARVASSPFCAAVDWGTSSFRLWLLDGEGEVLAESRSHEGMMHCASSGFAPVLNAHLRAVGADGTLPVMICGMAGARQGWVEAAYALAPTRLADLAAGAVAVPDPAREIRILPGIAQEDAQAPNVMRGEETQLLGGMPGASDALACMPGTHSKWVTVAGGAVRRFDTFMTGELFSVLARHSILKHAVDGEGQGIAPDHPAFLAALDRTLETPSGALADLFGVRAAQLLGHEQRADGAAHLSGLLIGAELAAARARHAGVNEVVLIASGGIAELYLSALKRCGFEVETVDAEMASRRGLHLCARQLWGTS